MDERAVAAVLGDCTTAEEFHQAVAALDAAITRIQPHGQLAPERQVEGDTRVGSLVALGRVLEGHCGGADMGGVPRLRALHAARNSYPAHPGSEDLASAPRTLGVDRYPPRDWQLAWWQVTATVAEAIADIRGALQTSGEEEGAGA